MAQLIDLETAVREIVNSTRNRRKRDETATPFFFIVGAGISAPHVPVASAIEKLCHEAADRDQVRVPTDLSADPMERYERMLTLVHPNAADRQEFLHQLIRDAPISPANLRLAHILESGLLTNLVITPNFDEMLSKALRLFGVDSVVCDHPKTTQRIDPNRTGIPQIVHVHGTHWFYDCCNLKGEITLRATADESENVSMADLLNRILAGSAPIVVGYSGWTSDVIMTALRRWLRSPVRPHNVYWFCYRASEAEALPDWLKNHGSVRIVTAGSGENALEARVVFEKLIAALNAPAPRITANPLAFLAEQLEAELGVNTGDDIKDIYLIRQVIARVRRGVELEAEERDRQTAAAQRTAAAVEKISDAMRRAAYDEAFDALPDVDVEQLQTAYVVGLITALRELYVARYGAEPDRTLAACKLWQRTAERGLEFDPKSLELEGTLAHAMTGEALCHDLGGRPEEVFKVVDALVERFAKSASVSARQNVVGALANRALLLSEQEDQAGAETIFAEIEHRFRDDPAVADLVDGARVEILSAGQSDERVVELCDEYLRKHRESQAQGVQHTIASILSNKAEALRKLDRNADAAATAQELVNRFGDSRRTNIRISLANGFLTRVRALTALGDSTGAEATLREFEQRYASDEFEGNRALLASAQETVAAPSAPKPARKKTKKP